MDEPLIWYNGSVLTDRRWLVSDHQGTIIAHLDSAGATQRYTYGPYGEPDAWGSQTSTARFRYTGQAALPEVGLYHYKARVYDPVLGRFLQTDPVGYNAGLNLYAYVMNDPLNAIDPGGLSSISCDPACTPEEEEKIRQAETAALAALRQRAAALRRAAATSLAAHPSLQSSFSAEFGGVDASAVAEARTATRDTIARLSDPNFTYEVVPTIPTGTPGVSADAETTAYGARTIRVSRDVYLASTPLHQAHTIVHEVHHAVREYSEHFRVDFPHGGSVTERSYIGRMEAARQHGPTYLVRYSATSFACFIIYDPTECRR